MEFYRIYDQVHESGFNGITVNAYVETWYMIKETPCGYWISQGQIDVQYLSRYADKWVSKTSRKRYAYPTMEEAINSYKKRKHWQLKYARHALEKAQAIQKMILEEDFLTLPGVYIVKSPFDLK